VEFEFTWKGYFYHFLELSYCNT